MQPPKHTFEIGIFFHVLAHYEMGWRKAEDGFSSFFVKFFLCIEDFSKWNITNVLLNFEKSSKMAKIWQKMKKIHVQLSFNPLLKSTSKIPKSYFCKPSPPLIIWLPTRPQPICESFLTLADYTYTTCDTQD